MKPFFEKECSSLFHKPSKVVINGHNTNKPPIERFTRFISDKDANGDSKPQYYVSTNQKTEITVQEKQSFGKNYKEDPKMINYMKQNEDK